MRISVIPVPDWCVACSSVVPEAINHELDGGRSIGHEYEIKLLGISIEESKSALPYSIDPVTGNGGGSRC